MEIIVGGVYPKNVKDGNRPKGLGPRYQRTMQEAFEYLSLDA